MDEERVHFKCKSSGTGFCLYSDRLEKTNKRHRSVCLSSILSSWGWFGDSKVATKREQERRGSDGRWVAGDCRVEVNKAIGKTSFEA
uniref:Putative ovule protein n=1 Tax=Solanum chacoense TaxID=4108 RepID=A0A0V0HMJ9_SOLCH